MAAQTMRATTQNSSIRKRSTHVSVVRLPLDLSPMEIHFRPETEFRLRELAQKTGRAANDLIQDAMAGYLEELAQLRITLDNRYDDLKSGRVQAVDGEAGFQGMRRKNEITRG